MFDAQIFQLLGLVYLSVGLGILINPEFYKRMIDHLVDSPVAIFISGILAIIAGYFLIILSPGWSWGWPLLITIIGWISLLKGFAFSIFPKAATRLARRMSDRGLVTKGLMTFVIGVWFLILGFLAF